ncbi:disease resistance protein RPM1-like [Lolium rigidum]|uniref:disease resistance protein RPM1-like n=1 Tax=Lolium rigidum TaxID=89674 RepID=UPI001F5DCEE8|nr:disease resistance protein RPM1-like [Lolium rigidum]
MTEVVTSQFNHCTFPSASTRIQASRKKTKNDSNMKVVTSQFNHPEPTFYENPDIITNFPCRAWIRMMHPFNPKFFVQSLVEQFNATVGFNALLEMEKTARKLAGEFNGFVNKKYLIVINDLSTIEEWDRVKKCFPNNKMGSRIIVSTMQVEVASLCAGQESIVSELKQLSADQNIYAFHKKVSQETTYLAETDSRSNRATTRNDKSIVAIGEILEDQSKVVDGKKVVGKSITRIRTMAAALEESQIVGREKEKEEIVKLVTSQVTNRFQVVSVWGMGGLGKTTLVKDIYHIKLSGMFEKRACVTVMRPFSLVELLRSLVMQLEPSEKKDVEGLMRSTKKIFLLMPVAELIEELARILERKRCLVVLDDVSSTVEWDMIIPFFHGMENSSRIIVTTREEDIAKHCSEQKGNIYMLKGLEYKDACDLFAKKVFKKTIDLDKKYPELTTQAELILQKCSGLPLAIVTIGGFLANQPKTALEWRKLNEHISTELEVNPMLGTIRTVLMRSYDGLPYHLKSCFLYMPIFREDQRVGRGRLVRRWSAEGYSREVRGKSMEKIADGYFMELISRSMILPSECSIHNTKGINSCQVHDLMRDIGISKSMEENLVFTLEEGCSSNSQATMRHLAINGNWQGDQGEFESIVDMSRVRSMTVFGEWKSFFIFEKMRLLRVLDLEDTTGLHDHHFKHIGKLLHLRYLSLRGCDSIYHLPDSLGNLRELVTLDVRGTKIIKLPRSIFNLQKLSYLRSGRKADDEDGSYEGHFGDNPKCLGNRPCILFLVTGIACCCKSVAIPDDDSNLNCHDACTALCCYLVPFIAMRLDLHGVLVQSGMRKLKALHTLGVVNIARRGKDVLKDIKGLIQLRKLGVTGVSKENGQELCLAIVGLSRLESLSIRSEGEPGLSGCLDGEFSFPENLQSLKLYGNLVKLPEWIKGLRNLVKLKLRSSMISEDDEAIQVLGDLPNLASLHLLKKSFEKSNACLTFRPHMFLNLVVLELDSLLDGREDRNKLLFLKFEQGATPKLELLKFVWAGINSRTLSGLPSLASLKEVLLKGAYSDNELAYLRAELPKNTNLPVIKRV